MKLLLLASLAFLFAVVLYLKLDPTPQLAWTFIPNEFRAPAPEIPVDVPGTVDEEAPLTDSDGIRSAEPSAVKGYTRRTPQMSVRPWRPWGG